LRFLKTKRNNRMIIEPLERSCLFKHCTGGFSCVSTKEFSEETIPILQAHGVELITYEGGD
jgi:hypothetical protein